MSKNYIQIQQEQNKKLEDTAELVTTAIKDKTFTELHGRLSNPSQIVAQAKENPNTIDFLKSHILVFSLNRETP